MPLMTGSNWIQLRCISDNFRLRQLNEVTKKDRAVTASILSWPPGAVLRCLSVYGPLLWSKTGHVCQWCRSYYGETVTTGPCWHFAHFLLSGQTFAHQTSVAKENLSDRPASPLLVSNPTNISITQDFVKLYNSKIWLYLHSARYWNTISRHDCPD